MITNTTRTAIIGLLAAGSLLLNACTDHRLAPTPDQLPNTELYVLNNTNQLLRINVRSTNSPLATLGISGMQDGERLLAIDFRPATGQLYGVGSTSRLYVINPTTGAARPVGTEPFSPALNGTVVGLDFNPTVDRIRLTTNTGQNLRLNPETGTVAATDGAINGAAGAMIADGAYTNNRAGVTTTTLYNIDPATDRLYIQNPPNNGTQVDVGALGLDITGAAGFDIAPDGNAVAAVTFNGASELQQVNLTTGRLQKLGNLPGQIIGLAIPTEPIAYAVDSANNLHIFNPTTPTLMTKALTGLQSGEQVVGIDFRPANGQLYALGSSSRLYTINTSNGAATAVGSGPFATLLNGNDFGFDFNPTVDRIRVISNTGQNLRLHPETGAVVATDGALNGAATGATATAYTNNFAGATTTTMFVLNTDTGRLYIQNPPNNGTLVDVGSLGLSGSAESVNGFDIGGASNMAYALLRINGTTRIYSVNTTTGAATPGATLPGNPVVRGFALGLGF